MTYSAYSEYKDSGVEWLGRIPIHWAMKPLKYVSYINSDVLSEATDDGFEFEYVDIGSVSFGSGIQKTEKIQFSSAPSRARRLVKNGDVIVSTVRTYLRAIAAIKEHAEKYVVSTGFCVVTPAGEINSEYCSYMLQSPYFVETVVAGSVGVSYPATNASDIANIDISLPQKEEQTQIATFLDRETKKIDRLIEKQQQLIKLLQEKRQAVISHAVTKGLNPDAKMKESGVEWLGEIPEHWEVKKFSHTSMVVRGGSPRPAGDPTLFNGDYSPWVTVAEITNGNAIYLNETNTFLTKKGSEQCRIFKAGTLLLSNSGATLGVPKILNIDANANDGVVGFENLNGSVDIEYAYFHLHTMTGDLRERTKQGAGQPNLNTDIVKNIAIPNPPLAEQKEIVIYLHDSIRRLDVLKAAGDRFIDLLKERRTALISAAVTGKIDVRNIING